MDDKIVIRHISRNKAHQNEVFPVKMYQEVVFGREKSCQVRYDPERDDLVSRKHARISINGANPPEFSLQDLGSRNGTFVNRRRISAPVKLLPGDRIQLGAGGPECQFDLESGGLLDSATSEIRETAIGITRPAVEPRKSKTGLLIAAAVLLFLVGLAVAYTVLSARG